MNGREVRSAIAQALLSLSLSILALLVIAAIEHLAYTRARDVVIDILTYPGALFSSIFYPEGVHTGRGSPGWAYVALAGNVLFYTLVWFLIIRLVSQLRIRAQARRSGTS